MIEVKQKIYDTMFTALFSMPKYLRELYLALHPEDINVTEESFTNVTIKNVLADDIYNDLGFMVNGQLIILVEAQSTWSVNIVFRSYLYLAKTYKDYIHESQLDVYGYKKLALPKPELYVIYTGEKGNKPEVLSLADEFFGGDSCIDVKVKVVYSSGKRDIINQYIGFSRVFKEQKKIYSSSVKAVEETIKICKDKDILKEFLTQHEKEVKTMFDLLYNQEEVSRIHNAALIREAKQEGEKEGEINAFYKLIQKGRITVQEAAQEIGMSIDELMAGFKQYNLVL